MRIITIAALLLLAFPAWGADGDNCFSDAEPRIRNNEEGQFTERCFYLCDDKTSASSDCTAFTLDDIPDVVEIEISEDVNCSGAAQVDISHASGTATNAHTLGTLTRGGTTALKFEQGAAPLFPVITTALSTMTACTEFDVRIHLLYTR